MINCTTCNTLSAHFNAKMIKFSHCKNVSYGDTDTFDIHFKLGRIFTLVRIENFNETL
jgi:hypothetical protein